MSKQFATMNKAQSPEVFISYASHDVNRVVRIADCLESSGVRVWRDQAQILGGNIYGPKIVRGIRESKVLMLMCSDASMRSDNVAKEILLAWKYRVPYLPLLLEPTNFPEALEYWLEGVQWIEVLGRSENLWLQDVLKALSATGVACRFSSETDAIASSGDSWLGRIRRILRWNSGRASSPAQSSPGVKVTFPEQGLKGLRAVAKYTDRMWPVSPEHEPRRNRSVRDLGAPQDGVQHSFPLGSRVRLAIESDREGHLLLLDEGTSGTLYCLCPSQFAPDTRIQAGRTYLPLEGARYDAFPVTGQPGREHLLAVISDEPLGLNWMSVDPAVPARRLDARDTAELMDKLRELEGDRWIVLSTYFDVV